jgi:hypothetical protein
MNQFVLQLKQDHASEIARYGGVYIAILPNGGHYDLEVEVAPEQTIGGVWPSDTDNLIRARAEADALESALIRNGVPVFATRDEWERQREKEEE